MATVKVNMTAFGNEGEVRMVELDRSLESFGVVLRDDGTADDEGNILFLLEEVFRLGQNDFQPQRHPSVSVGDVVEVFDTLFVVLFDGFRRIERRAFEDYLATPRRDRSFHPIVLHPEMPGSAYQ